MNHTWGECYDNPKNHRANANGRRNNNNNNNNQRANGNEQRNNDNNSNTRCGNGEQHCFEEAPLSPVADSSAAIECDFAATESAFAATCEYLAKAE